MKDETIQEFKNQEKESEAKRSNMVGGIFMVLMGGVALLAVSGVELFGRSPWILFALLPIFWIVTAAYNKYVENGRQINRQVVFILLDPFSEVKEGGLYDREPKYSPHTGSHRRWVIWINTLFEQEQAAGTHSINRSYYCANISRILRTNKGNSPGKILGIGFIKGKFFLLDDG